MRESEAGGESVGTSQRSDKCNEFYFKSVISDC